VKFQKSKINHRLRKAVLAGASIDAINAMSFDFNYRTNSENIVAPDRTVVILAIFLNLIFSFIYIFQS
jgi:NADH-quinone oxidoreductase subunit G